MGAMTLEAAQRANLSLARQLEKEERRSKSFQQENAGLLRKRELMLQEIEQLRARAEAVHPDTVIVQRLRSLVREAQLESEILDGPGIIATVPVSELVNILRAEA